MEWRIEYGIEVSSRETETKKMNSIRFMQVVQLRTCIETLERRLEDELRSFLAISDKRLQAELRSG